MMVESSTPYMRPFLSMLALTFCVTSGLLALSQHGIGPTAVAPTSTHLSATATSTSTHARIKRFTNQKQYEPRAHEHEYAHSKSHSKSHSKPKLEPMDIIYHHVHNTVPIVNEEYKVIFFQVAKAASSQWVRFFMRLNGDPLWCSNDVQMHNSKHNHLRYLSDYTLSDAQEMMTSPEWTRAIFVRHPKPRLLSAFLDKAVVHESYFSNFTCKVYALNKVREYGGSGSTKELMAQEDYDQEMKGCVDHHEDFSFFLHNVTTTLRNNVHWRSIASRIDEKWWPSINFVGYMENLSEDAERFLKTIRSSKRFVGGSVRGSKGDDNSDADSSNSVGITAWDYIGKTGWSGDERDCTIGTSAFLAKRVNHHQTSARDHMLGYYTPQLESFVENHYADDLNNHYFHFEDDVKLFGAGDQKRLNENSKNEVHENIRTKEDKATDDDDGEEFDME